MSIDRRAWIALLLALPSMRAALAAQAAEPPVRIEGRSLPRRAVVAGTELQLNGAGVRAVAWFKAFVAALYLAAPARSAAEVLAAPGPKRLQLHLLTDVPAVELTKALRRGVERNSSAAEREPLAAPLSELAARIDALGTLRKGDVLQLDWDPTRGVLLELNGTLKTPARDAVAASQPALYAGVLRAFLGDRPYANDSRPACWPRRDRTHPRTETDPCQEPAWPRWPPSSRSAPAPRCCPPPCWPRRSRASRSA